MSIQIMTQAWKTRTDNHTQKLILLKLADNASDEGYCFPSLATIASHCQCSRSTVAKHLKAMKEKGWLTIEHRYRDNGSKMSNGFYLSIPLVRETDGGVPTDGRGVYRETDGGVPTGGLLEPSYNHKNEPSKEPSNTHANDVSVVFNYWSVVMKKENSKLTGKRRQAINARLKEGYSVLEIKRAIDNCARSAWHNGKNDRGQVYNDIELICRNGVKLERFRDMPVDDGLNNLQRTNLQHMHDFLNEG